MSSSMWLLRSIRNSFAASALIWCGSAESMMGQVEVVMDHFDTHFDNDPCEVYFFETWTTYAHPVTPVGPIPFEKAVVKNGYYRAWICEVGNEDRFVLFEGLSNRFNQLDEKGAVLSTGDEPAFYFVETQQGQIVPGDIMTHEEVLAAEQYLVNLPNADGRLAHVRQHVEISFVYSYNEDGSISKATIKNPEGGTKVIEY